KARRGRSSSVPSGWHRRSPKQASWTGRGGSSNRPSHTPTTWASSPRKSTRKAESSWATSRRPSATSGWSTRPGRYPRPSGRRRAGRPVGPPAAPALSGLNHQRADAGTGVLDLDVEIAGLVRSEGMGHGVPGLLHVEDDVVAVKMDLFLPVRRHVGGDPIALM